MLKQFIALSAFVGLTLAGPATAADTPSQSTQRQLRSNFGLVLELSARGSQDEGVAVKQVLPSSPAFKAGLRKGDLITRIGKRDIEDFADLDNAFTRYQLGERLRIQVERDGERQLLTLIPRPANEEEEDRDSSTKYGRNRSDGNGDETLFQRLQQRFRRLELRLQEMERQGQYGDCAAIRRSRRGPSNGCNGGSTTWRSALGRHGEPSGMAGRTSGNTLARRFGNGGVNPTAGKAVRPKRALRL